MLVLVVEFSPAQEHLHEAPMQGCTGDHGEMEHLVLADDTMNPRRPLKMIVDGTS